MLKLNAKEPAKLKEFIALLSVTNFKKITLVYFRILSYKQEMVLNYKQNIFTEDCRGLHFAEQKLSHFFGGSYYTELHDLLSRVR